jgi:hypothetical protein
MCSELFDFNQMVYNFFFLIFYKLKPKDLKEANLNPCHKKILIPKLDGGKRTKFIKDLKIIDQIKSCVI